MIKGLTLIFSMTASLLSCKHPGGSSQLADGNEKLGEGQVFLKDRGIVINSKTLVIESFTDGKKPEDLKLLEVGDTLAEAKVLVEGPNRQLEPLDKKLPNFTAFENLLKIRVKKKDLAVTLRFARVVKGETKMFGVTVPSAR